MKLACTLLFITLSLSLFSQKRKEKAKAYPVPTIDSIFVHLYTDSLKKGTYNYINIDGKLSNGHFLPLDSNEIIFSSGDAKFEGNNLWIPEDFKKEKVTITVILRSNPAQKKTFDVYIKKNPDPELKSEEEIMKDRFKKQKRN